MWEEVKQSISGHRPDGETNKELEHVVVDDAVHYGNEADTDEADRTDDQAG